MEDFERALWLTHTFWGGRVNPILPIDAGQDRNELARSLVEAFSVDALYPVADASSIKTFIEGYNYLPWPKFERELFLDSGVGTYASFLDVYHPLRTLFEEHIRDKPEPRLSATLYEWQKDDPLRYVFLSSFGGYPSLADIKKDYADFFVSNLRGKRVSLRQTDPLPADAYKAFTPSALSVSGLNWRGNPFSTRLAPGFFVGNALNFDDLVDFWNLRASNIRLLFHDLNYEQRLGALRDAYVEALSKQKPEPVDEPRGIVLWSRLEQIPKDIHFGPRIVWSRPSPTIWNGLNVNPLHPYISEHSVLASVSDSETPPSFAFQLPEKPFYDDPAFLNQSVVVSVSPIVDLFAQEESTIKPPYIPELNTYYGREAHFSMGIGTRSEREGGLGIITDTTSHHLTIRALSNRDLISHIFELAGISATHSPPGLVARRLIKQMGGLQGCRVFKITGVRGLIEKYGALKFFTRGAAVTTIGNNDPATGRPRFEDFEGLYIEQRDHRKEPKLKPEHAFRYLVKKGVFRAGLELKCPDCQLGIWVSLDDIATETRCELCGAIFNITAQLHDRDWAYRRSGLFGREDNQQGSIPVALVLQQMDTMLSRDMSYATAMNLTPITAEINACETDFVIVNQGYGDRLEIAIGECKAAGEIEDTDVQNLNRVADAFPPNRFSPFIVFAKTSEFTPAEVERCRIADNDRRRVILLSRRELEPYFVYQRTEKEFEIGYSPISLDNLARATQNIYFDPRVKKPQQGA